jgi:glutathione S-transferase
MLKLYGAPFSRAAIVQWYLEECEIAYEYVLVDLKNGEHLQPAYLQINPFGKVPAIVDEEVTLWESGAILLYLWEKYSPAAPTLTEKAIIEQWVLFANSTLGNGLFLEQNRAKEMPRLLTALNSLWEKQPFLLGDRFTVADVAVGSILAYVPIMLKIGFEDYPAVADYVKRLAERPAFQKTIGNRPG